MTREEIVKSMSLQDAIEVLKDTNTYGTADIAKSVILKALEQEPKTGHWEYGYAFPDGNYCKCSECKEIIKCIYPMHYCPNCGAKMGK